MSVTRIIILGVGFVAAIASAFLAINLTSRPQDTVREIVEVPSIETTDILVATKRLNRGDKVEQGALAWRQWPTASVTETHIVREQNPKAVTELVGTSARFIIEKGDPVQESKFVQPGQGFMASVLPKGRRAVSTPVSPTTGAGGFILPDDRVDVLMTRSLGGGRGAEQFVTEAVLRNIRVLAIDQVIQEQDGVPVVVGKTATLELSDDQVKALTVAQQLAERITLALRSLRDNSDAQVIEATHLLDTGNPAPVEVAPIPEEEPISKTIKIVRYGRTSVVTPQK